MKKKILISLTEKHIKGTPPKSIVTNKIIVLNHLTKVVSRFLKLDDGAVYINTRVIKHLYDKKPAEEFYFLICNLDSMVRYPDRIYENRTGKRGEYCFVKKLKGADYVCSLEDRNGIFVVTAFRVRDKKYLEKYVLLWSWENDKPPS